MVIEKTSLISGKLPNHLLNYWEQDSICSLWALLANRVVLLYDNDEIVWPHDSKGSFTSKDVFITHFEALNGLDFLIKSIEKSKAPTKA